MESQIRALDIEINRTKNKIKYMEKQLFPTHGGQTKQTVTEE